MRVWGFFGLYLPRFPRSTRSVGVGVNAGSHAFGARALLIE